MTMASKKPKPQPANAMHLSNDDETTHVVGIGNLRVLITQDREYFFAQELEVDYFAQNTSLDDAKVAFEKRLAATVGEHLKVYGNIDKLLVVAPKEVWQKFLAAKSYHV